MDGQRALLAKNNKSWISLTGYRTLYVLKLLLEKSRSIDELVELLKSNSYTNKAVSRDTVRLTINTLRKAGCDISKLNKKTDFKYELYSHPFVLSFTQEELDALIKLRISACGNISWKKILVLNDLFDKLFKLTKDNNQIDLISSAKIFAEVDRNILEQIASPNLLGKRVKIKYFSPKNGDEVFDIVVGDVSFSDGKLYLSCFNYKYNSSSLLNIERIKEIITVGIEEETIKPSLYSVEYELFGDSLMVYEKAEYETIVAKNDFSITVKALVVNEFCFIQRLLLFGADFKVIYPDSFREKLINKIRLIQKGYGND